MELDDLKYKWQQADKIKNLHKQDIMELIHQKSYGPLASLKRSFRKQIVAMTLVPIMIIAANMEHLEKTLSSALFWFYILFCIGLIIFARINFNTVRKIEEMDGIVKSTLQQQLLLLEIRLKQKRIAVRIALLFFVVLTEVLPYLQHFSMLDKWHSLSPFTRFGAYALLFLFQYFVGNLVNQRKFGRHIDYLKELVREME